MTDNEIIKALMCCIWDDCDTCPAIDEEDCIRCTKESCIDLINRQNAEIERLKSMCQVLAECRDKALIEGSKKQCMKKMTAAVTAVGFGMRGATVIIRVITAVSATKQTAAANI